MCTSKTIAAKTRVIANHALARAARNTACVFEAVEQRRLMSVSLSNGVLTITEGSGNDKVTVQQLSGYVRVTENGLSTDWTNAQVQSFNVSLGNGNDSFNAYAVNKPMTISGGAGNDTLSGGRAADSIFGNEDTDELNGYEGADLLSGGGGIDSVVYYNHASGVNVTLDNVANDGLYSSASAFASAEFDNVLSDVENVTGSTFNDFLFGNDANNALNGYYGNDFVDGGKGNDALRGGYGNDTLQGNEGNDWMWGGLGADLFNGGNGNDDARYDEIDHTSGVLAALPIGDQFAVSYNNGSPGEGDRIRGNVENLAGSYYNDSLYGNNLGNGLSGMNGDDFVSGGGGNDWVNGNTGNDRLYGDGGNDFVWGEHGADVMSGGEGWDDVRYDDSYHNSVGIGVNARLSMWYDNKYGNGNYGENDYIAEDFEALIGTNYNDVLSGNAFGNYIAGLDGNDILSGNAGDDTIDAGRGADNLFGDAGNDTLLARDGTTTDRLDGGEGWDTCERDTSRIRIFLSRIRRDSAIGIEVFR